MDLCHHSISITEEIYDGFRRTVVLIGELQRREDLISAAV